MIKKYWYELTLIVIFVLSVGFYIGVQIKSIQSNDEIKQLKNEVVEAYDKGYSDGERDTVIDFMEDYYDVLIENAVLKNQPKNEAYIKQIVDDFEFVIELQQHYYQENITSHSFGDWLQINYPELYRRIESYF
jgi:hypothetical protein